MTTTKPTAADAAKALDTLKSFFTTGGGSAELLAMLGERVPETVAAAVPTLPLDKRLWLFPYKGGSESAEKLSEKLGILKIKREGSTFVGKAGAFILNWGAGTGNFNANIGFAKVLNPPNLVDIAINKKAFFSAMLGDNAPRLPFWTTSEQQARAWLATGYKVVIRKVLEGSKGEGIVLAKKPLDFQAGKLYTMLEPSTHEYRTYVFDGKVIDAREKVLKAGETADPDNMRYDDAKYLFKNMDLLTLPGEVILHSERCAKKLGLLTGGVDVIYNSGSKTATVLEFNTAPYLGDYTVTKYANALKDYISQQA